MRRFFGPILISSVLLGLILPVDLGDYLPFAIWTELFVLIFLSYFSVKWEGRKLLRQGMMALGFYGLRFWLLPVLVFFLLAPFSHFYALVLFLLVLLPSGITTPALSSIFGGRVEVSMLVLLLSNLLSPFVIPVMCVWILGNEVEVDTIDMLLTLLITIVLPFLLHLPLRKIPAVKGWVHLYSTSVNISLMFTLAWLITGKNQALILGQPEALLQHVGVLVLALTLFYLLAYYWLPGADLPTRIGYSVSSGANNIALGMALGYTYFNPEIGFFFVAGVIVWTGMLVPVEWVMRRLAARSSN
jgi:BASS family bile acid:Na+ symporter